MQLKRRFHEGKCLVSKRSPTQIWGINEDELNWSFRWERLKELGGVRCRSMENSFTLVSRIKGIFQLLSTLEELHVHKPWLYTSPNCIMCTEEVKENISHLVRCSLLEELWQETEVQALKTAWTVLTDESRFILDIRSWKKVLLDDNKEKRYIERELYISGIAEKKKWSQLYRMGLSKKEANLCIYGVLYVFQKSFYHIIWKERCDWVIRWEKLVGISRKMKRKHREDFNLPVSSSVARPPSLNIPENEDRKRRKQ